MNRPPYIALAGLCTTLSIALPALGAPRIRKCKGETWAELASQKYSEARLAKVLAIYNRRPTEEGCKTGRLVRFPLTVQHELMLGQTVRGIVERFLRSNGAFEYIRKHNKLPKGVEPNPGTKIELPAELALELGSQPKKELEAIYGIPKLQSILKYNRIKRLRRGKTIYIPVFLEAKESAPPPPPPPPVAKVDPPPPEDPNNPGEPPPPVEPPPPAKPSGPVALTKTLQVGLMARPDQFLHITHQSLLGADYQCALCHVDDPRKEGAYKPLDQGLCTKCHSKFQAPLVALRPRQLPLIFSHDLHLNEKRTVIEEGYKLDCNTCHAPADKGMRSLPAHAECAKCHNKIEAKPAVSEDCQGCHGVAEEIDRMDQAKALLDQHLLQSPRLSDVRFAHDPHIESLTETSSQAQVGASCGRCHEGAQTADTLEVIEPQRMADCLNCHRGLEKEMKGESTALDQCQTCHIGTAPSIMPSASRVLRKPLSHTPFFRRNHKRQAARDDGTCAACHTELAGGTGENCDQCHARTRPRDHTVRWREEPHGRAAERAPERCQTCHLQDRCADCHSIAPRDHFPRERFLRRHRETARVSVRRCQTCHIPQVTCARCHDLGVQ